LLVALIAVPSAARAQIASALDSYLMRPQLDGDSRNPPRFSRTARPAPLDKGFTYQPGRAAGTTGFESSNRRGPKAQLDRRV